MTKTCPYCNSSEIEEDLAIICTNCGAVLEESNIVSDVQFQERAGGHDVIGQFVSRDRAQPTTISAAVTGLPRTESREITFQKGRKRIQEIANQLRINQHCIELAFGFFKMCVTKNLTRGRNRSYVVVSCLYMACRSENTSHLLLDFSDATRINIFDLGRALNFLTRSLFIKLPPTDPCMYVLRFANMLDFGDQQKDVALLATRIIQRMKKDWMNMGRRPTGICGAALLLAARALNLNRSVTDIVNVVNISHAVVKKRLDEFANTPSGLLTIDEFNTVDLEESEEPPAFQEARKKRFEEEMRKRDEEKVDILIPQFEEVRREFEVAIQMKMKNSPYAKMIVETISDSGIPELSQANQVLRDEVIDRVYELADIDAISSSTSKNAKYGPSLTSLGLVNQNKNNTSTTGDCHTINQRTANENMEDDELDLTGIDDEEIQSYILTEAESSIKAKFWTARNSEHLALMAEKKRTKEEEKINKTNDVIPKKRRKICTVRKKEINANDPNEAMLQVIQERNLSNKINYDILKQIEEDDRI